MNAWYHEYRRLFLTTRFIGIVASIILIALIFREILAVQHAIAIYEEPMLSDGVWWQSFRSYAFAGSLILALFLRGTFLIQSKYRSDWLFPISWLIPAGLFIAYSFSIEPSSTYVCNEDGICYGIYSTQHTDWTAIAASFFFPASLFRFIATGALAFLNLKFKLK